ncbi:MAG: hypothetical protein MRQ07_05305 [Candidatus Midichloria sp.]|nr:hypothetical protein [Candidatus Midichloria sp.]
MVVLLLIEFTDKSCYIYDLVVLAIPASTFKSIDFSNIGIADYLILIQYGKNFKISIPVNLSAANSYCSVITTAQYHFLIMMRLYN